MVRLECSAMLMKIKIIKCNKALPMTCKGHKRSGNELIVRK